MPIRILECAGKLYRPSNGTEGDMFQALWCERCVHDGYTDETPELGCELIRRSMAYFTTDPEYPREWIFDPEGVPMCIRFEEVVDTNLR